MLTKTTEDQIRSLLENLVPAGAFARGRVNDCAVALAALVNQTKMNNHFILRTIVQANLDALRILVGTTKSTKLDELLHQIDRDLQRRCRKIIKARGLGYARTHCDDVARTRSIPTSHWWAYPVANHRPRSTPPTTATKSAPATCTHRRRH